MADQELKQENGIKLLGVTIDDKLNFHERIAGCSRMSMEFYSRYSHTPPGCVCSLFLHNVLTYLYMRMRNVMYNRC